MNHVTWPLEPLAALDLEEHERPFCGSCGAPTVVVERHGDLWLECAATQTDRSFLRKLMTLDLASGHTRRQIVGAAFAS